jgi:hypothetical protein
MFTRRGRASFPRSCSDCSSAQTGRRHLQAQLREAKAKARASILAGVLQVDPAKSEQDLVE